MNVFEQLFAALAVFGWQGALAVGVILLSVIVAKKSGIVATGDQARIATLVLGAILEGLGDNPTSEGALMAVLSAVLAGLAHTGLEWLGNKYDIAWLTGLLDFKQTN